MSNGNNDRPRTPSVPHLATSPGTRARAITWGISKSKGDANNAPRENVVITFEITADGPERGKTITWWGHFSDKTWEFDIKALRACGWRGDDIRDLSALKDNEVSLVINHEDDTENGGKRARVRWVNAIGFAITKPLAGAKLDNFAARVRALSSKVAAAQPADAARMPPIDNRGGVDPRGQTSYHEQRRDSRDDAPFGGAYGSRSGGYDSRNDQRGGYDSRRDDRNTPPPDDRDAPWNRGRS